MTNTSESKSLVPIIPEIECTCITHGKHSLFSDKLSALFKSRKRLYVTFFALFCIASVFGVCLYFTSESKAALNANAVSLYSSVPTFRSAVNLAYSSLLFSFFLFLFGMTLFAPLACIAYLSYFFTRFGLYSIVHYNLCMYSASPSISFFCYISLNAFSLFLMIVFACECWKFSLVSADGVAYTLKRENFVPYFVHFVIYSFFAILFSYYTLLIF